jgi:hypothetical protein
VQVVWDGGTEIVQDAVSVDEYLPRTLQLRTALKDQSSAEFIGGLVLSQYAEPKPRFRQITVKMHDRRLSVSDRLQVAALDIGDVITVVRKAPSIDYSDVVSRDVPVEGVEWRFTRDGWTGTFALGDSIEEGFVSTVGFGGAVTTAEIDNRLYRFHTFTENGTFGIAVVGDDSELEVLLVGGGGGGSNWSRAGGGGGGRVVPLSLVAEIGDYPLTVGAGGAFDPSGNNAGASGGNSTVEVLDATVYTAPGGGGGGGVDTSTSVSGGSGGGSGGSGSLRNGGAAVAGTPVSGFGNDGGKNFDSFTNTAGGGGGGADSAGGDASSGTGGNGGNGRIMPIDGNRYGAGGGGIGLFASGTPGTGQGVANSGSGGNAGEIDVSNRNGSNGVVIFRYPLEPAA